MWLQLLWLLWLLRLLLGRERSNVALRNRCQVVLVSVGLGLGRVATKPSSSRCRLERLRSLRLPKEILALLRK